MPLPAIDRTIEATENAVKASFRTYWEALAPLAPIAWQNKKAPTQPDTGWMRWQMNYTPGLSGDAGIESGTQKLVRRQGVIIIQLFVPSGSGETRLQTMVENALLYFENREPPTGIWYRNVGPAPGGDDGSWFSRNVTAEFTYDVLRA